MGNYWGGLLFAGAGVAVLVLWPSLVIMAVIWIALGLVFLALGFRSARKQKEEKQLLRTGTRAEATVADVLDTNVTVNKSPYVELTLHVRPDGAPAFELKAKKVVSRLSVPQIGDTYAIRYDPEHPEHFAWDESAPVVRAQRVEEASESAAPRTQDPLDRLEKLADLKAKGVLTEAEFAAEKAKILG